jgi:hypothetical protein
MPGPARGRRQQVPPKDVEHSRYIFAGKMPPPIAVDAVNSPAGKVPVKYSYRFLARASKRISDAQSAVNE